MQASRPSLVYWLSAFVLLTTSLLQPQVLPAAQPMSIPVGDLRNAPRIAAASDRSSFVRFPGHAIPRAAPGNEAGAVPAGTILHLEFTL